MNIVIFTHNLGNWLIADQSEVQAMSVSEDDDESSGETDYVVLGEPVSKQMIGRRSTDAVKQTNMP